MDSVDAGWAGAFEIVHDADGWQQFRRLDGALLIPPATDGLAERAKMCAGIHASWKVTAGRLVIEAEGQDDGSPFDVLVNGVLRHRVSGAGRVSHDLDLGDMPPHSTVQLWLPQYGALRVLEVSLKGEDVAVATETGKRWIAYGSSITQCRQADGPSEAWPALVARQYGWQLQSLGFGGECQLDPAVESTISQLPADFISLCLGINTYNVAAFSGRTFASQVLGFVSNIRRAHPGVPIAVISPVLSLPREEAPNSAGWTLSDYRNGVAEVVRAVRERGDHRIQLVDGGGVFTPPESAALMPDTLHPNNDGYRLMAARLGPQLAAIANAQH
ncbi:Lysophospholipase L1 [Arthrobacter sp. yr096]|uniref:GDSL-type esterase/lipase family protein n=1 Tax=Arthrobacter sp. yr096 TaxID=1761750 RepID=UPI0008C7C860|nr:GDSL-type esterase/lipase family protein [Arthrobacter sp. yr096]SEJ25392.1 Lysophospholipase L1 [Arthrobacter sp. yr096]